MESVLGLSRCVSVYCKRRSTGTAAGRKSSGKGGLHQNLWVERVVEKGSMKIMCAAAAAGCSLMGLAKNALDPASVTGRTQPFRRKRQRASGYAPGTWLSLLCRGVAVSPRRGGPQSEEDEWVEFARGDAETQRSLLCVLFSPRLRVSAGDGFRYCVVEFLFHGGVGGRDRRRMSGASFPQRRWDAERLAGSKKKHVCSGRLQFDGVGEKRAGYCVSDGKNTTVQTQTTTRVRLR